MSYLHLRSLERAPYSSSGPYLTHFSPASWAVGTAPQRTLSASLGSLKTPSLKLGRLWRTYSWPYPDKPPAHPQSNRALWECEPRDLAPASVRQKSEPCFPLLRGPRFLKHETPSNCLRSEAWEALLTEGGASSRARLCCRMLLWGHFCPGWGSWPF